MKHNAWIAALFLGALPFSAQAQVELGLRDVMQARAFAMGGAYRALGVGTEVITGNPAALAVFPRYQIELGGAWDFEGKNAFGSVSVLDSSSGPLAAGVSYQLVSFGQGLARRTAHVNTLAFSLPVFEGFYLGASAKHLLLTGASSANAITSDAGVLFRLFNSFTVSATAHNWIDTQNPELSPYYSFSGGFLAGLFSVAVDARLDTVTRDVPTWSFGGGAEYVSFGGLPLRAGYLWDGLQEAQFVSGGLGFLTQGGALDLAYRHELGGRGGKLIALTFRIQR